MTRATIAPQFQFREEPETFVGEVRVQVELENTVDRELVRRGMMRDEDVRRLVVPILVDTGAAMLMLPEDMAEALGLRVLRTAVVAYADQRTDEHPVAGSVTVRVAGREATLECVVGPPGSEPLLGQVVLEIVDLLVDCPRQRLVPRPESPFLPSYKMK